MEPLPRHPEADPQHQLPPGGNKLERISSQTRTLVQEMKHWMDLRITLTKLEIQQEIEARKMEVVLMGAVVLLGALGGFFLLVTLALVLGAWLGQPFWGFLIVTALLFVGAGIVYLVKPGVVREARDVKVVRGEPDETSAA